MIKKKIYFWKNIPNYLNFFQEEYNIHLKDYFTIYLFDTKNEMYKYVDDYIKKNGEYNEEHNYNAITKSYCIVGYDKYKNVKFKNDYGFICFCKKFFYGREISHEVGHITVNYFNNVIEEKQSLFSKHNKDFSIYQEKDINIEELFCYMLGNINNEINKTYWKLQSKGSD